jgi:two-component system, NarL family, sensor histidine kinase UhpB
VINVNTEFSMNKSYLGRIMVVDDEVEVMSLLRDLLSELGYEVAGYTSCREALKALEEQEFDLLLTDLIMSDMDGITFFQSAQKADPFLVCIMITGHGTIKTAVEATKSGVFDYITKPPDWKTLQPLLSRAMELHRLKKSEAQYRSIVEDQTELICRCNPEGTLSFVNEAYCRYFGKTRDELIGQSYLPFIPFEDHERLKKHIAGLSKENPAAAIENRVIAPDGAIRWQQWMNRALFDERGRMIELQLIGRDITDRKAAEEKLKESEGKYRLLIENVNESIVAAQDGVLKFVNSNAIQLLGYSKEEILFRPFIEFIHPDDRAMVLGNYAKRMKGEEVPGNYSFRVVTKDGVIKWLDLSAVLFTWDGRPATLNFLSDITERKKAEEELKKSHEQLRNFAKRLAEAEEIERQKIARELHDQVGQNLTALGINLSILRNQLSDTWTGQTEARLNDSMGILEETAKRIRDVMSDLRPSVLDDYGLMVAIRWFSERISKRTGLTINVAYQDTKVDLPSETEITLFRIAQELLTNITKHAKATEVSIRLDSMDGKVQFVIVDNGVGFDPAALKKIGESRWGLLNVRERTDAIDGILTIASRHGHGTRVVIEVKK